MIVTDSPTTSLPMSAAHPCASTGTDAHPSSTRPTRLLRRLAQSIALQLLDWSADHASPAAHTTATQTAGLSHAQRIRRHHQQRALEAERDRATAHAHMGPLSI